MFHAIINGITVSKGGTLAEASIIADEAQRRGADVNVVFIPLKRPES